MFLIYDEYKKDVLDNEVYLCVYIKGGHAEAKPYYKKLINYANKNKIVLDEFGMERMLIDQYISSDLERHITEIMIPIIDVKNK